MTSTVELSFTIRSARLEELEALAEIELDANLSLVEAGVPSNTGPVTTERSLLEQCLSDRLLFVAAVSTDRPIGFLAAAEQDGALYIGEIDVARMWQRRGVGRTLIRPAIAQARSRGLWGAMLTTDRYVPFNAPFYASCGFREVSPDAIPPSLALILKSEIEHGSDPMRRVAMVWRFE